MYNNIDFNELFDNKSQYVKENNYDELLESRVKEVENIIGYKIPKSYIEFLKIQNGGYLSDRYNKYLILIYGIAKTSNFHCSLEEEFLFLKDECEYPNIGIPFGETQSGGHDMYYMDYSSVDSEGEPRIVRIDNEGGTDRFFVAKNFEEFINMVYNNQDIYGTFLDTLSTENINNEQEDKTNVSDLEALGMSMIFLIFSFCFGKIAIIISCTLVVLCIIWIIQSKLKIKK